MLTLRARLYFFSLSFGSFFQWRLICCSIHLPAGRITWTNNRYLQDRPFVSDIWKGVPTSVSRDTLLVGDPRWPAQPQQIISRTVLGYRSPVELSRMDGAVGVFPPPTSPKSAPFGRRTRRCLDTELQWRPLSAWKKICGWKETNTEDQDPQNIFLCPA